MQSRRSGSFSWTTNPQSFETKTSKQQLLTQGSVSYQSDDIFQPQRDRNKGGRGGSSAVSVVAFFDFSSPETIELRLVLGPLPGMTGLQVLTFIDGERTLRSHGATVGTKIDSVNGHRLGDLHWTKALHLFRGCLSGEIEPLYVEKKKKGKGKLSKLLSAGTSSGSVNSITNTDVPESVDDENNNDTDDNGGEETGTKFVDFYFSLEFTLPEIVVVTCPAPLWAVGVKFGPGLSGLGVQVESVREDCSLGGEGVVSGSRLLRVDDFELASRNTGGGISYHAGLDILLHTGLVPESYGGYDQAFKAELAVNQATLNQASQPQTQTKQSSFSMIGKSKSSGGGVNRLSGVRPSVSLSRGSGGSTKYSKMVSVVFTVPFTKGTRI